MKKKLLTILILSLCLCSCKNKDKENLQTSIEIKNDSSSKEDISNVLKTEKKDSNDKIVVEKKSEDKKIKVPIERHGQYQDIYDKLQGRKLYLTGGSMVEAIYFYRDGYFDGVEKGGNGGHVSIALYNGKFVVKKKLSDTSYLLSLERLDSDLKLNEEKKININGNELIMHYTESLLIPKESVGKDFILTLPDAKFSDLSEIAVDSINMIANLNKSYNLDEKTGIYLLSFESMENERPNYLIEFKK